MEHAALWLCFLFAVVAQCASATCLSPPVNETRLLSVTGGHYLFIRLFGCASGPAVLFLHGGWGPHPADESQDAGGLIDGARYLIVMFHQRGWGQSMPSGDISHNSLADSVADCEAVREAAGVDSWATVYGGSNGATLGLAYASTKPHRVGGIVLRFFTTSEEYGGSATPSGVLIKRRTLC